MQSKDERAICDELKAKLEEIGLSVYEDRTAEKVGGNTGNVLAVLKGTVDAPVVLFSSHMDRVKNPGKIGICQGTSKNSMRSLSACC